MDDMIRPGNFGEIGHQIAEKKFNASLGLPGMNSLHLVQFRDGVFLGPGIDHIKQIKANTQQANQKHH
jgi:hypothetical protein